MGTGTDGRKQDRGPGARRRWRDAINPRDNWYRDLIQLVVAICVAWTLVIALPNYLDRLQASRVQASISNCRLNTAQDDVLRALINASLADQAKRYPHRDPEGRTDAQRRALADQFMRPLGGLDQSDAAQATRRAICRQRADALVVR